MNKQIKFGIVLQYAQMILNILISLIYTPIMLKILGQSEYGIYNLASSIISYLSLLSLGFGSSYIRFYSRYKSNNDEEGIKKLNGLYLLVFSLIGVVALISGALLYNNVSIFFNDTYSATDLHIAKVLMIFLTINLAISFPASVFVSYITSQEKFIFQKLVNIGKTILSPLLSIVLLYLGYGSIGMVIVTTIVSLIIDVANAIYCFKKIGMRIKFDKVDFKLLKEIAVFSVFIAINSVIDQINWQTDKIILGKMINSTAVAIYAVASTINNLYITFSTSISSVFTPKINKIVSDNKENMNEKLTRIFISVGRIQLFVIGLVITGFIFFGKHFLLIWAGEGYDEAYYTALLLMIPTIVPLIQNVGIEIQRAKNQHKFRSVVYLLMAVINVFVSIWLCDKLGIIGVSIGTASSIIIANIFIMNIYYHKKTGIDIIKFWKEIVKTIPSFIVPIIFGILVVLHVKYNNFLEYATYIIIYCIIYVISIYCCGLNKEEKQMIIRKRSRLV